MNTVMTSKIGSERRLKSLERNPLVPLKQRNGNVTPFTASRLLREWQRQGIVSEESRQGSAALARAALPARSLTRARLTFFPLRPSLVALGQLEGCTGTATYRVFSLILVASGPPPAPSGRWFRTVTWVEDSCRRQHRCAFSSWTISSRGGSSSLLSAVIVEPNKCN
jgi:hypothetical protein